MSSGTRVSNLRQNQGTSSSAYSNETSRRRVEDESNWMEDDSWTEDDTTDEESRPISPQHQYHHHTHSRNQSLNHAAQPSPTQMRGREKPLIAYVTNEWQSRDVDEKLRHYAYPPHARVPGQRYPAQQRDESPNCCDDFLEADSCAEGVVAACGHMTFKVAFTIFLVIAVLWAGKMSFSSAAQRHASSGAVRASVQLKLSGGEPRAPKGRDKTWFGTHFTADFEGLRQIGVIRDEHWEWAEGKRLVIVGDVHGCSDPLQELLAAAKFEDGRDHLVFTGDLVSKGPDTAGVLDLARKYNASCVRGNHDDRLILLHRDLSNPLHVVNQVDGSVMTGGDGYTRERELAAALSDESIEYLMSCPLILDLGELKGLAAHGLVAHAGLVPGLDLKLQDPSAVMNMRSIDLRTHTPIKVHSPSTQKQLKEDLGAKWRELPPPWNNKKTKVRLVDLDEKYVMPWNLLWDEHQHAVPRDERTLLVYGHDAAVGLVQKTWSVGLDSGCVGGGRLSALILEMNKGSVTKRIESVPCQEAKS